jgi:hypothetical protein
VNPPRENPTVYRTTNPGRARGGGCEFVLACDLRFASRENTLLGQQEVGVGDGSRGRPMARLSRLVGRGRALEILLVADDLDGPREEQYGYVNRLIADYQLDAEVEEIASRLARFDHDAIARTKSYVDHVTLPANSELGPPWHDFLELSRGAERRAQAARLQGARAQHRRRVRTISWEAPGRVASRRLNSGSGPETRQILRAAILGIGGHTGAVPVTRQPDNFYTAAGRRFRMEY